MAEKHENIYIIIAYQSVNIFQLQQYFEQFVQSENYTNNAFDMLYFLDDLNSPFVCDNSVNMEDRVKMYSIAEEKYLQEIKIKEQQAAEYRKKQIAEIDRQQGNDTLLIKLGLQKRNVNLGHGISDEELQRMKYKITDNEEKKQTKPSSDDSNNEESDSSFDFKSSKQQNQEQQQVQKPVQRRGVKLNSMIKKIN